MTKEEKILNKLLVETFSEIMAIESKVLREKLKSYKVSIKEIHLLEKVIQLPDQSMGVIADSLNITRGTLTTAVKTLEKKGYVKRFRTEDDIRLGFIEVTDKGLEVHRIHMKFHEEMMREIIRDTNVEQQKELIIVLQNLINYFESLKLQKGKAKNA